MAVRPSATGSGSGPTSSSRSLHAAPGISRAQRCLQPRDLTEGALRDRRLAGETPLQAHGTQRSTKPIGSFAISETTRGDLADHFGIFLKKAEYRLALPGLDPRLPPFRRRAAQGPRRSRRSSTRRAPMAVTSSSSASSPGETNLPGTHRGLRPGRVAGDGSRPLVMVGPNSSGVPVEEIALRLGVEGRVRRAQVDRAVLIDALPVRPRLRHAE